MKQLSEFKDNRGIEVAAEILGIILEMQQNEKNAAAHKEKTPVKMFSTLMKNSPDEMRQIFALLSEEDTADFHCNGAEALTDMLIMANDPIIVSLFMLPGQTGDATSSASHSENTEDN